MPAHIPTEVRHFCNLAIQVKICMEGRKCCAAWVYTDFFLQARHVGTTRNWYNLHILCLCTESFHFSCIFLKFSNWPSQKIYSLWKKSGQGKRKNLGIVVTEGEWHLWHSRFSQKSSGWIWIAEHCWYLCLQQILYLILSSQGLL